MFTSAPCRTRVVVGAESSSAKSRGVLERVWYFEFASRYSQVKGVLGLGGGPSMMVSMRWISLSMPALTAGREGLQLSLELIERSTRASSRSLAVMTVSMLREL